MNIILKHLHKSAETNAGKLEAILGKQTEMAARIPRQPECFLDQPYGSEDTAELAADIYRPAHRTERSGRLPVVMLVHGGGLFAGSRKNNRLFCELIARRGFLVYALEYRHIDEADAFGEISDICAGFSFVSGSLEQYGGDPDRIFLMGESAGAFLSVYAAAAVNSWEIRGLLGCDVPAQMKIRGLLCFSGMFYTTRRDMIGMVYKKDLYGARSRDRAFLEYMVPTNPEVLSNLPPLLLTSSGADFLKKHTLRFAKEAQAAEHSCELLYYPKGRQLTHAFISLKPMLPESREALREVCAWMKDMSSGETGFGSQSSL